MGLRPSLEAEQLENLLIFRLAGELTSSVLNRLKVEVARQAKEKKMHRVLLNMGDVEYITSKDLGVFVQLYRFLDAEREGSEIESPAVLAFSNLNAFVQGVIELTKLETVFPVFDTEEKARTELSKVDFLPPIPPS